MATFSGRGGSVGIDTAGDCLNVRNWTITETANVAQGHHSDNTAYWGDSKPGKLSFSGSFDFYQDDTTTQPEYGAGSTLIKGGERLSFSFNPESGGTAFTGTLVSTEITYTNDIEGGELVSGSCSFVGHGKLYRES